MKDEILQIAYSLEKGKIDEDTAKQELCVLLGVVESWVCPMDNEPPLNTEVLAKDPNGNIHLTAWRESYSIFSCQGKREDVYGWVWKNI
jgi:hypothetical protein